MEESKKGWKGSEAKVLVEALNLSPPVGSKARKIHSAMLDRKFNKDSILKPSLLALEGATNVPFHEFFEMVDSGVALTDDQLQAWQKVAIALGYPEWQVDYEPSEEELSLLQLSQKGSIRMKTLPSKRKKTGTIPTQRR